MQAVFQQALMRRRIVRLHERLRGLLQLRWSCGQSELVIIQAPLDVEVRFHEIFVALAAGTQQRIRDNRSPL